MVIVHLFIIIHYDPAGLTRVVLAVVLLHDALVAEAQVHLGAVRAADRAVVVRAHGLALARRRDRGRRAGRLQLVTGADFLVAGRRSIDGHQDGGGQAWVGRCGVHTSEHMMLSLYFIL